MSNYVAVSKTEHKGKAFFKSCSFLHAAGDMFVPLLIDELPHVLSTTTIVFKRNSENQDQFKIGALQSFVPGKNWYVVPDGRWLGGYIPAVYRGYPFALLPEAGSGRPALHFDLDSGLLMSDKTPDSHLIFGEGDQLSPIVNNVLGFLEQCERSRIVTQFAVDALACQQLLIPWEIKFVKDHVKTPVDGELYRVDEDALKSQSATALHSLQASGALSIAYAQIFSRARLSNLAKLYDIHQQFEKVSSTVDVPDFDLIFGHDQSDVIKFN